VMSCFRKRGMDATPSGHSSESAAQMVKSFLAALPPEDSDRFRRIILSFG